MIHLNIDNNNLSVMRSDLEKEYLRLENKINKLRASKKNDVASEYEMIQDLIDEQISLLDTIIFNLENTPKLYNQLLGLNKKYKQVAGDYNGE